MSHNRFIAIIVVVGLVMSACVVWAQSPDHSATPTRGIAVLASTIGYDVTPEELARFVEQGKFSPVVIDWAWITYHWERTSFRQVNKFLDLMAAKGIPVAAMYRPRFLTNPTAATQMGQDGRRGTDHAEICYSDVAARKWGISWGTGILERCPRIGEVIIYNPLNQCRCQKCITAGGNSPHSAVITFLSEAKAAWKSKRPDAKLGLVSMPVADFWKATLPSIDVAHPYLCIKEDVDPAKEVANINAVSAIIGGKMGACLGKITWEEGAKVSIEKLKSVDQLARENDISYFFWTYDTLFRSSLYDAKAVVQALGIGSNAAISSGNPLSRLDRTKRELAAALIKQVQEAAPGAPKFEAIDALAKKAKDADPETRNAIAVMAIVTMNSKQVSIFDRWPCCYIVSRLGGEPGASDLMELLLNDESETIRAVAAEALGGIASPAAREAMAQAAKQDSSRMVRDTIARYLGKDMPALDPGAAPVEPTSAGGVEELAPSGPPSPPAAPARPVTKPLPWPFPGDNKEQSIFNNYQTCPDDYIHCALDFIHPAGTPVTAVGPGYVAAIFSNPPHTHDFFVVTPEKGGSRGWCYTHMDPQTWTFKEGDFIQQGQMLGKLVEFSVDGKPGMDHLDLSYVSFVRYPSGQLDPNVHPLLDPLYFFDWKDTVAPSNLPLRFVSDGSLQQFPADVAGMVTVNGKADILAAITDSAYAGQESFLGVPVVMLSISDGTHTMQKLVLDHRGDVGDKKQIKPLYLLREETKKLFNTNTFPYYQGLRVTKTDGDGKITPKDAEECWDTTARDSSGKPLWPDGKYNVNVYAWDIAGNRGVIGATVQVKNGRTQQ